MADEVISGLDQSAGRPRGAGWLRLPIRLQLAGGLLFTIGVPLLFHIAIRPQVIFSGNLQATVAAAALAHLLGYFAYRRFDAFPGMAAAVAILPTFALSYAVVFTAILLLRLDYSRVQAVISFLMSVSWYFGLNVFGRRLEPYRLAIVPGGETKDLHAIEGVVWHVVGSPEASPGQVHGVVADLRADLSDAWERFITNCALSGTPVYHVKQIVESLTGRVAIEHMSENTLGSLSPNQPYIQFKTLVDRLTALGLLVTLSPLLAGIALAIRLESPGPALFRQERMGYRGKVFTIYKFRTMRQQGPARHDEGGDKEQAKTLDDDVRITPLGRLLRRTRLDELPQAINILRGEMSWIGPRPEALSLSRWYEAELPFYHYRHIVRPGITGWAQVNQGHVTDLDEVLEKLHYDFYYIKNFSLSLDLLIVTKTIVTVITGFGAR